MPVAEAERLVDDHPDRAVQAVADAARTGEPAVLTALEEAGEALGRAIDDVVGLINPDVVILGGYLGTLSDQLLPSVERLLGERLSITAFAETQVRAVDQVTFRVAAGAVLAARDAVLYDPLTLTSPLQT